MAPSSEDEDSFGVPRGWLQCPKIGEIVEDLFLPFKTPLCGLYDNQMEARLRFHPEDVFNSALLDGKKMGLWCDFTKTDRFYFVHEVEKHGCIYKKIRMEEHEGSPAEEHVQEFVRVVQNFVREHPGEIIGVHCTHGFNRTGFAIASYLATVKMMDMDYAIKVFALARPCGIFEQDMVDELMKRYGDYAFLPEVPEKPSWEYDEDVSGDYPTSSNANGTANGQAVQQAPDSGKKFMDGLVKHVYLETDLSKKQMLRSKIQELCNARRDGFPGLQPDSLRMANMSLLSQEPYLVSWKADGMRCMVYIMDQDEVYAFDRDNEVFHIEGLDFPHRVENRSVTNTLVDAEMIIDKHVENGVEISTPRLIIYDIIQFEELNIGSHHYDNRRICIDHEIIRPRKRAQATGTLREQPMGVRIKDFWDLIAVPELLSPSFTKNLGHEIDGLIFQPKKLPYMAGRCDKVLKWKPPSHNSVDFLLNIRKEQKPGLLAEWWGYLYVQHLADPVGRMKATKTLQKYDNKIIECSFDVQKREWIFMRERTDKSLPNAKSTYESVFESMINPVTQQTLINYIMQHCVHDQRPDTDRSHQVQHHDDYAPDSRGRHLHLVSDNLTGTYVRELINGICQMSGFREFPALEPQILRRHNLDSLSKEAYLATYIAGCRYLLLIDDKCDSYAMDKFKHVFYIEGLDFPHRKENRSVRNTLVDVEMIIDKHIENGVEIVTPRLLIYDMIQFEGLYVGGYEFGRRRKLLMDELVKPWRCRATSNSPIAVGMKAVFRLAEIPCILNPEFSKNLGHEIGGVLLQPTHHKYMAGASDRTIYSWSLPSCSFSFVFLLKINKDSVPCNALLYVQDSTAPVASIAAISEDHVRFHNRVVDCFYDAYLRKWSVNCQLDSQRPGTTLQSFYECRSFYNDVVLYQHLLDHVVIRARL